MQNWGVLRRGEAQNPSRTCPALRDAIILIFDIYILNFPITFHVMWRLWLLVSIWFQVYFTPLTGVLFTFPSRYLFTIDLQEYLALPVSSGRFLRATRVSKYSRTTTKEIIYFHVRDYYPLGCIFPDTSVNKLLYNSSRYKTDIVALQPPT